MKFSEQWLRTWVDPNLTTDELVSQMTMAGLEVAKVEPVAGKFSKVKVGEIRSITPHPKRQTLSICKISLGTIQSEDLSIVCGATNIYVGMKTAVALLGAQLPNGQQVRSKEIEGEHSQGMLCAAAELGLEERIEGVLQLPDDAPLGTNLNNYLKLDDRTIDIDLTPNRGDCLSILGVAREIAALNQCQLQRERVTAVTPTIKDQFSVKITEPKACGQYTGRIIRNINSCVITPLWIKERLRRSGLRAIAPVVDITNYVMLELGQPIHAFDLNKLVGNIEVRLAYQGEHLVLLDGRDILIEPGTLVIADQEKPLALAGIMGGIGSGISEQTTDLFLESAYFAPEAIAGRARMHGLSTDASHRYERGVDAALQKIALERVTNLLTDIVGGSVGPVVEIQYPEYLPTAKHITLQRRKVKNLLGVEITDSTCVQILEHLGMDVELIEEGWQVTTPTYRFDLSLQEDLIEEIARFYGYDNIPLQSITATLSVANQNTQLRLPRLGQVLRERGYHQVINYSFVNPKTQQLLGVQKGAINLLNALSPELSQMCTSLWPGLIDTVKYNQYRQYTDLRFFESGTCFKTEDETVHQQSTIAGIVAGKAREGRWYGDDRFFDFYDVKADVEAIFKLTRDRTPIRFIAAQHSALHSGQTALIKRGDQALGWIGALHPQIIQALEITGPVFVFELPLSGLHLPAALHPYCKSLSKFPIVRRDLSFLIDVSITAQQIKDAIISAGDDLLLEVKLFDVYQGKGIKQGQKSIAVSLVFQHHGRTLADCEIVDYLANVIKCLKRTFNIHLRE